MAKIPHHHRWDAGLTLLGWGVALTALTFGVPLFIRMPPWCDLTLYDVAARTVIAGGTLYRDVFDTNFPGFVWCLILIRRLGGESIEIVRMVDLVIVATIVILLIRALRRCGASSASVAWFAASVALFYPFTTEFSHAQRDVWMTLPMLAATLCRVRHIESGQTFRAAFLEGALWGVAVGFKPHALIVAGIIFLTARPPEAERKRDLLGNLTGGATLAIMGILALMLTGTWTHLVDVFQKWNTSYLTTVWAETGSMFSRFLWIFPPWSLLHIIAVPIALKNLRAGLHRRTLAVFYIALLAQACLLQRNFDYVHVPEMLLAFTMIACALPRLLAAYTFGVLAVSLLAPSVFQHPIADRARLAHWASCFRVLPTSEYRQRQNALALSPQYFSSIDMVEISEVGDWLRAQGVRSGDVIAWHDSPHAVYLELGHIPPFRFMHITTTLISERNFERATRELRKALPRAKYVVSDIYHPLRHVGPALWARREETGPDLLPPFFSARLRQSFPFDQPAVFRSRGGQGRYIVHCVVEPVVKKFEFEWHLWE